MKKIGFILLFVFILVGCNSNTVEIRLQENVQNHSQQKLTEGDEEMSEQPFYPQLTSEVLDNERVVEMKTNYGTITIKLFPEKAPKAVENFLTHAQDGYYDGVTFHRVIKDFMIQGGDPTGTGMGGESIYGEPFEDEFSLEVFHLRGALSMANAGPNTNGSQFFIVQKSELEEGYRDALKKAGFPEKIIDAYMELGGTPHLDHRHTVFGHVIKGMDVVDKIANVKTTIGDKPVEDVVIEGIEIVK